PTDARAKPVAAGRPDAALRDRVTQQLREAPPERRDGHDPVEAGRTDVGGRKQDPVDHRAIEVATCRCELPRQLRCREPVDATGPQLVPVAQDEAEAGVRPLDSNDLALVHVGDRVLSIPVAVAQEVADRDGADIEGACASRYSSSVSRRSGCAMLEASQAERR